MYWKHAYTKICKRGEKKYERTLSALLIEEGLRIEAKCFDVAAKRYLSLYNYRSVVPFCKMDGFDDLIRMVRTESELFGFETPVPDALDRDRERLVEEINDLMVPYSELRYYKVEGGEQRDTMGGKFKTSAILSRAGIWIEYPIFSDGLYDGTGTYFVKFSDYVNYDGVYVHRRSSAKFLTSTIAQYMPDGSYTAHNGEKLTLIEFIMHTVLNSMNTVRY